MADAPLAAVGVTEQARGGEEEPAPAPHPQVGVVAIQLAQNAFDLAPVSIEIAEPDMSDGLTISIRAIPRAKAV